MALLIVQERNVDGFINVRLEEFLGGAGIDKEALLAISIAVIIARYLGDFLLLLLLLLMFK